MGQTILLIGTLDTKGDEFAFARDLIEERGHTPVLLDVGVLGGPSIEPDHTAYDVAQAAGTSLDALREAGDRGAAMDAMTHSAAAMDKPCSRTSSFAFRSSPHDGNAFGSAELLSRDAEEIRSTRELVQRERERLWTIRR